MSKTVIITLTGKFRSSAVSVDDEDLPLSGGGEACSATLRGISEGSHKLTWSVDGTAGSEYTVSLSGDTDPWERPFTMVGGSDDGNKHFTVK
jgi:hypothetical protein